MNEETNIEEIEAIETRADMQREAIARSISSLSDNRTATQREIERRMYITDFMSRPNFNMKVEEALADIFGMLEGRPMMEELMRTRVSLYRVQDITADDDRDTRIGLTVKFSMWTHSNAETNKALYYELMSFCRDGDAPFCDPNCSVKVSHGTTIALPLTIAEGDLKVTVEFTANVPDHVIAHLSKKGMIQADPGYAAPPSLAIVCARPSA